MFLRKRHISCKIEVGIAQCDILFTSVLAMGLYGWLRLLRASLTGFDLKHKQQAPLNCLLTVAAS